MHKAYYMDGDAVWLYYAPGTAIWLHRGMTRAYNNHDDAVRDLLQQAACTGGGGWNASDHECIPEFPALYQAALATGLDTLQFLRHADMPCGIERTLRNMALEIQLYASATASCQPSIATASACGP